VNESKYDITMDTEKRKSSRKSKTIKNKDYGEESDGLSPRDTLVGDPISPRGSKEKKKKSSNTQDGRDKKRRTMREDDQRKEKDRHIVSPFDTFDRKKGKSGAKRKVNMEGRERVQSREKVWDEEGREARGITERRSLDECRPALTRKATRTGVVKVFLMHTHHVPVFQFFLSYNCCD
tara:strand:- start:365 stop:898 length:534 start_codon:yes stop_codon:yes gene_type:complete